MIIRRNFLPAIFLAVVLSACGQSPEVSSAPTEPGPTEGSVAVISASPTTGGAPTPTPSPQSTPTETALPPTAAPTALNPEGPYVVFAGPQGIWIANPDGSFPTQISQSGIGTDGLELRDSLSADGGSVALTAFGKTGIDLFLVDIPSGQSKTVARLLDVSRQELAFNSLSPKAFAYYAITDYPDLAWQPGGDVLAFVGADPGPTTDMYTYDRAQDKSRRLETDPAQAIRPIWSPDGEYLLYFGIDWLPPFGQTYVTLDPMAGFWAVRASDGELIPQPKLKGTDRNFVGWRDDTHYLVYDSDESCAARDLRAVDLLTGDTEMIAGFCFHSKPAWSPANGAVLLSVWPDCDCGLAAGVYLYLPGRDSPLRLAEKQALETYWLPESGYFYAYPEALFSADGQTRYDPPAAGASYHPAVSAGGFQAWEIVADHHSRVTVMTGGGPWRDILEGNVSLLAWDPASGDVLLIVLENGELYSAAAPDFQPKMTGRVGWDTGQAVWIA
jgi:dipeptidyl aminopeptidase/acylaminoacyl peptidase